MPVGYSIYVETPSILHQKIDPRTKMLGMMTVFILALEFNHPLVLAIIMVVVLAIGVWAKLSLKRFLPFLLGASLFFILGVLVWPAYIKQGLPLFDVFGLTITLDGILFGIAMGLRVSLMVVASGVWMMSTSPQKMTLGLLRMGLPYKAGLAMSTSIRFVPLINAERATIMEAQRARGLRMDKGNPLTRASKSVAIIGPMFLRAIDLAQALAVAMDARGFGARENRTNLLEIQMTTADKLIIGACVGVVVAGLILRLLGVGVLVKGYL